MIKHAEAPIGSEASPDRPSSRKVAEIPNTVSAPNQVAKTIAKIKYSGSFLFVVIKSLLEETNFDAYNPRPIDNRRYIKIISIIFPFRLKKQKH